MPPEAGGMAPDEPAQQVLARIGTTFTLIDRHDRRKVRECRERRAFRRSDLAAAPPRAARGDAGAHRPASSHADRERSTQTLPPDRVPSRLPVRSGFPGRRRCQQSLLSHSRPCGQPRRSPRLSRHRSRQACSRKSHRTCSQISTPRMGRIAKAETRHHRRRRCPTRPLPPTRTAARGPRARQRTSTTWQLRPCLRISEPETGRQSARRATRSTASCPRFLA